MRIAIAGAARPFTHALHAAVFLLALLSGTPKGGAQDAGLESPPAATAAYVRLEGKVESVEAHAFQLRSSGPLPLVQVEMDDWDPDADASMLRPGDLVTVHGLLDLAPGSPPRVEAASVYVERLGNRYFANSLDEEARRFATSPLPEGTVVLEGSVRRVEPADYEFFLDAGQGLLRVETVALMSNPQDGDIYERLQVAERVRVQGRWQQDAIEGLELDASQVTELPAD